MSLTTIKYIIKPDGNVEEEVQGVFGHDCQRITKSIESEVGEVVSRDYLASFLLLIPIQPKRTFKTLKMKTGVDAVLPGSVLYKLFY